MSVDGYEEILMNHLQECEECQSKICPTIEDCPDFKKYIAKLEARADYEYERMKEEGVDRN